MHASTASALHASNPSALNRYTSFANVCASACVSFLPRAAPRFMLMPCLSLSTAVRAGADASAC
eukprot:6182228-Pleurochrysis_carterae.AAC.5